MSHVYIQVRRCDLAKFCELLPSVAPEDFQHDPGNDPLGVMSMETETLGLNLDDLVPVSRSGLPFLVCVRDDDGTGGYRYASEDGEIQVAYCDDDAQLMVAVMDDGTLNASQLNAARNVLRVEQRVRHIFTGAFLTVG